MTLESFLSSQKKLSIPRVPPLQAIKNKITRGVKKKKVDYMADFETINDDGAESTRVWAWGLCRIDDPNYYKVETGIDIASFMDRIAMDNNTVYFHNLKFDGKFIIDYLLKNGFYHVRTERPDEPGTFTTLISDMGTFYTMVIKWDSGQTTELRDSLKKLPMAVERIAKAFQLEESKGSIDYTLYREVGHELTVEEDDYLRRDIIIPAQAMKQVLDSGMKKLTVASDSMAEYKKLITNGYFQTLFPVFNQDMDMEVRRAYRGGFTYADSRFSKRLISERGIVLDVNSLYPSVMKAALLPFGMPMFVEGEVLTNRRYPLSIFSVTFTAKLKPDHIPCIQIKRMSMFISTEYLTDIPEPITLMVTNVDWELYNEQYDIDILAFGSGWLFQGMTGMFDKYIDKWAKIKENETGGKREIAKLHLNSLYGKFASNPNVRSKVPYLEDDKVKFTRTDIEVRNPVYTPVGVFITSYARAITIRAAQQNYDRFAYADTDSLHLFGTDLPENMDIHPTRMGAWKLEYTFVRAFYVRSKFYMEEKDNGDFVVRAAGLPERLSSKLRFDDLYDGHVIPGKLVPKAVPGGVVLKETPWKVDLS